ncbi:MAG: tRNA pseudouridine(38-40) synthase TruA [Chitinophagaceae bacterium]
MPRYFIELAYKGTRYSGFQTQQNANTIQGEVERAFEILVREPVMLTGSSRTDAGVHALQNFFHFDTNLPFEERRGIESERQFAYKMNALLPPDIAITQVYKMHADAHARYDAVSREYEYRIYKTKNPFLKDTTYYYPFTINLELIQQACTLIKKETNFFAFSKTNTQVNNYNCIISNSEWLVKNGIHIYRIKANRFLRGMVRLLTATLLQIGRGKLSLEEFYLLLNSTIKKCELSVPPHGLFLKEVSYPLNYFSAIEMP